MNETILLAIAGSILGTVFMTFFPFILKKWNKEELKFDVAYIMTMLVAAIISTIMLPLYFLNSTLPINNNTFIAVAAFGVAALINFVINAIASHEINQITRLKAAATGAGAKLSPGNIDTKKILTVLVIALLIFGLSCTSVFAAVTVSRTIQAVGNITAVGDLVIYADQNGQTQLTTINWGNVAPGSSVTVPIYVKDAANYQMVLGFVISGYNPAEMASTSTVTWSYIAGTVVQQGNIQKVDLTFTAASNAIAGSFSFNIIVSGTQK